MKRTYSQEKTVTRLQETNKQTNKQTPKRTHHTKPNTRHSTLENKTRPHP